MALLGNVTIPAPANPAGFGFPISVEFGMVTVHNPPVAIHQFRAGNLKREQRYLLGTGARQWTITRELDRNEQLALLNFWEGMQGGTQPFTFYCPDETGSNTLYTVCFASEPIITEYQPGLLYHVRVTLIEALPPGGTGPVYSITSTLERFPSTALNDALTAQAQSLIKLVTIRPKKAGYPAIYMSDRLCTVGGITYQPRLLRWDGIGQVAVGLPGVGTESDDVSLVCGNADRVMRLLTDDVQLDFADVTCSFYHVATGILVNFWSGIVTPGGWQSNTGPEFTLTCSDKLSSPFLLAPPRVIDRKCNKMFNDAIECPFSTHGSPDTVNYPGVNTTFCDHGLTTPNGCYALGMEVYYNGLEANPQSIRTVDNSSGFFGISRNAIVAASLINDSAYGHCIPIVVTDIPFPVAAIIIAGRDEGDFYRAIGVVGEGPMTLSIGAATSDGLGSTLDGQFNHGFPGTLGARAITGYDPALPVSGPTGNLDGPFELYPFEANQEVWTWSAGTCGLELLRSDAKGIQLTTIDQHSMEALVALGWQGWVWNSGSNGSRLSTRLPMTNPVWFAANLYLLCQKLFNAPAAAQEAELDIPTNYTSAGICDLSVTRIVELDEGLETQWKFIGVLQDQKPLRDWLSDILLNCLGFYTWKNGKLSIGVRENASASVAYTDGNMIWRSLATAPLGPQFTRLTATFADREHGYVANTATYQDDDYAQELGGGTRPLHRTAQMNLSGTADISPATRFVATRAREEIGGVTAAERKAARKVVWRTSALGFDTAPGDVASITNEDMPGGFGHVRVERWKLLDDWTIELTGRTVTASMYDLVQGPKPADVRPGDIPAEGAGQVTLQPAWLANRVAAHAGDPIYDVTDKTFEVTQSYTTLADGSLGATLTIGGDLAVTDPALSPPPKVNTISQASTGGTLKGGHNYFFTLCATRGSDPTTASPSAASVIVAIGIPANTDTNHITLSDIVWPPDPGDGMGAWTGYVLFGAIDNKPLITAQVEAGLPLPTTISITSLNPDRRTYAPPNIAIDHLRVKVKQMVHPGVSPGLITAVGPGTIRCMHLASDFSQDTNPTEGGITWSKDAAKLATDNWTGRILSVISKIADGTTPLLNFTVTGYAPTTGTFTCSPDPQAAGVGAGDVFIVRFIPTWSAGNTSFTDLGMVNGQYPLGTPTSSRIGDVARILHGPGKGQTRNIIDNTSVGYFFDRGFVGVDATSLVGIEKYAWVHIADGQQLDVKDFGVDGQVDVEVNNNLENGVIVQVVTVDLAGNETDDELALTREAWVNGRASAGFGAAAPRPEPCTITGIKQEYQSNGKLRVQIDYSPPATLGSFIGVHAFMENPDRSAAPVIPLDGSTTPSSGTTLAGDWAPIDEGTFPFSSPTSPVMIDLDPVTIATPVRFYLSSFSETIEDKLVRANSTTETPTPSITITLLPPTTGSGEEYARLVSNVTATVEYNDSTIAGPTYRIVMNWTNPTDPPSATQNPFGGVEIWFDFFNEVPDRRALAAIISSSSNTWTSPWFPLVASGVYNAYVRSRDNADTPHVNSLVIGVTPYAQISETWPIPGNPSDQPYAPHGASFTVGNLRYAINNAGQQVLLLDAAWTLPTDVNVLARYGGNIIAYKRPADSYPIVVPTGTIPKSTGITLTFPNFPQSTETWDFYLITVDNNNNPNTNPNAPIAGTPHVTLSVTPPALGVAGQEYAAPVSLGTVQVKTTIMAEGGVNKQRVEAGFTAPADPKFGGVEMRVYDSATLIAKARQSVGPGVAGTLVANLPNPIGVKTYTVKFVSYDVNGRSNTETGAPSTTIAVGSSSGSFTTGIVDASTGTFINLNADYLTAGMIQSVTIKISNAAGSGVVTDITQGFDTTAGFYTGMIIHKNATGPGSTWDRTIYGPTGISFINSFNQLRIQMGALSGGGFVGVYGTSGGIQLDGNNGALYMLNSSGNARGLTGTDGSDRGYWSMVWGGVQRYAPGVDANGKRMRWGIGTFNGAGTATVDVVTGLAAVEGIWITPVTATAGEVGNPYNVPTPGTISIKSNVASSNTSFDWFAVGT